MTDEPEIAKASQREPCHETCRRLLHRPALQAPGQKHGVNIGEARMPCCTKMLARFFIGMGRRFPNSTTTRRGGTKPPTAAAQRRCSWPVPLPPFPCLWAAWFTDLLVFVCSRQRRVAALARGRARGVCVRFAPSTAAFSPEPRLSSTSPLRGWTRSAIVGVVRAIALV
ncbi:dTDP-glucose 4,6-dehydratase [Trypanosoma cruzi]|nr:dTDP-glucose 4,6-dehydratase [Trypanosoma cruzi]